MIMRLNETTRVNCLACCLPYYKFFKMLNNKAKKLAFIFKLF